MQVFHTWGVPPSLGKIILPTMGWTRKSKNALTNSVMAKKSRAKGPPLVSSIAGAGFLFSGQWVAGPFGSVGNGVTPAAGRALGRGRRLRAGTVVGVAVRLFRRARIQLFLATAYGKVELNFQPLTVAERRAWPAKNGPRAGTTHRREDAAGR